MDSFSSPQRQSVHDYDCLSFLQDQNQGLLWLSLKAIHSLILYLSSIHCNRLIHRYIILPLLFGIDIDHPF